MPLGFFSGLESITAVDILLWKDNYDRTIGLEHNGKGSFKAAIEMVQEI